MNLPVRTRETRFQRTRSLAAAEVAKPGSTDFTKPAAPDKAAPAPAKARKAK